MLCYKATSIHQQSKRKQLKRRINYVASCLPGVRRIADAGTERSRSQDRGRKNKLPQCGRSTTASICPAAAGRLEPQRASPRGPALATPGSRSRSPAPQAWAATAQWLLAACFRASSGSTMGKRVLEPRLVNGFSSEISVQQRRWGEDLFGLPSIGPGRAGLIPGHGPALHSFFRFSFVITSFSFIPLVLFTCLS